MNIAIALSRGGMNQTKFWLHSRFYNGQALKPLSFKVTMIYFRLNEIKVHILIFLAKCDKKSYNLECFFPHDFTLFIIQPNKNLITLIIAIILQGSLKWC